MKLYTKTGDDGTTGLFRAARVPKDHPRIEAYGTVDELNAFLGLARAEPLPEAVDAILETVQHELFDLGAELATPDAEAQGMALLDEAAVARLEAAIDRLDAVLPPLKQFILPGGNRPTALLHVARVVCRRGERALVSLRAASDTPVRELVVVYLNRLSDLLFVLARTTSQGEITWKSRG